MTEGAKLIISLTFDFRCGAARHGEGTGDIISSESRATNPGLPPENLFIFSPNNFYRRADACAGSTGGPSHYAG